MFEKKYVLQKLRRMIYYNYWNSLSKTKINLIMSPRHTLKPLLNHMLSYLKSLQAYPNIDLLFSLLTLAYAKKIDDITAVEDPTTKKIEEIILLRAPLFKGGL